MPGRRILPLSQPVLIPAVNRAVSPQRCRPIGVTRARGAAALAIEYRTAWRVPVTGVALVVKGVLVLRRLLGNSRRMPVDPGCFMR